uniref:Uncharacterized protein n=1 Tax=Salix viminalis TaxID=40686 RepID=A0A6N2MGK3_SALVM
MRNVNNYDYPIGKLRMQPVGMIIFAAIMATLGKKKEVSGEFMAKSCNNSGYIFGVGMGEQETLTMR